jgi:hypothetical protein
LNLLHGEENYFHGKLGHCVLAIDGDVGGMLLVVVPYIIGGDVGDELCHCRRRVPALHRKIVYRKKLYAWKVRVCDSWGT